MRQLKSCKIGHFVKHEGETYQVNCFYKSYTGPKAGERMCTLIPLREPEETKQLRFLEDTTKVEYLREIAEYKGKLYKGYKYRLGYVEK